MVRVQRGSFQAERIRNIFTRRSPDREDERPCCELHLGIFNRGKGHNRLMQAKFLLTPGSCFSVVQRILVKHVFVRKFFMLEEIISACCAREFNRNNTQVSLPQFLRKYTCKLKYAKKVKRAPHLFYNA